MKDDRIKNIERDTEKAKDSVNEIREAAEFSLDSIERVGVVGSMGAIKPRTSQLELYVRLSPHTAPELLGD